MSGAEEKRPIARADVRAQDMADAQISDTHATLSPRLWTGIHQSRQAFGNRRKDGRIVIAIQFRQLCDGLAERYATRLGERKIDQDAQEPGAKGEVRTCDAIVRE